MEQDLPDKEQIAARVHVCYPEIWPDLSARLAHLSADVAILGIRPV